MFVIPSAEPDERELLSLTPDQIRSEESAAFQQFADDIFSNLYDTTERVEIDQTEFTARESSVPVIIGAIDLNLIAIDDRQFDAIQNVFAIELYKNAAENIVFADSVDSEGNSTVLTEQNIGSFSGLSFDTQAYAQELENILLVISDSKKNYMQFKSASLTGYTSSLLRCGYDPSLESSFTQTCLVEILIDDIFSTLFDIGYCGIVSDFPFPGAKVARPFAYDPIATQDKANNIADGFGIQNGNYFLNPRRRLERYSRNKQLKTQLGSFFDRTSSENIVKFSFMSEESFANKKNSVELPTFMGGATSLKRLEEMLLPPTFALNEINLKIKPASRLNDTPKGIYSIVSNDNIDGATKEVNIFSLVDLFLKELSRSESIEEFVSLNSTKLREIQLSTSAERSRNLSKNLLGHLISGNKTQLYETKNEEIKSLKSFFVINPEEDSEKYLLFENRGFDSQEVKYKSLLDWVAKQVAKNKIDRNTINPQLNELRAALQYYKFANRLFEVGNTETAIEKEKLVLSKICNTVVNSTLTANQWVGYNTSFALDDSVAVALDGFASTSALVPSIIHYNQFSSVPEESTFNPVTFLREKKIFDLASLDFFENAFVLDSSDDTKQQYIGLVTLFYLALAQIDPNLQDAKFLTSRFKGADGSDSISKAFNLQTDTDFSFRDDVDARERYAKIHYNSLFYLAKRNRAAVGGSINRENFRVRTISGVDVVHSTIVNTSEYSGVFYPFSSASEIDDAVLKDKSSAFLLSALNLGKYVKSGAQDFFSFIPFSGEYYGTNPIISGYKAFQSILIEYKGAFDDKGLTKFSSIGVESFAAFAIKVVAENFKNCIYGTINKKLVDAKANSDSLNRKIFGFKVACNSNSTSPFANRFKDANQAATRRKDSLLSKHDIARVERIAAINAFKNIINEISLDTNLITSFDSLFDLSDKIRNQNLFPYYKKIVDKANDLNASESSFSNLVIDSLTPGYVNSIRQCKSFSPKEFISQQNSRSNLLKNAIDTAAIIEASNILLAMRSLGTTSSSVDKIKTLVIGLPNGFGQNLGSQEINPFEFSAEQQINSAELQTFNIVINKKDERSLLIDLTPISYRFPINLRIKSFVSKNETRSCIDKRDLFTTATVGKSYLELLNDNFEIIFDIFDLQTGKTVTSFSFSSLSNNSYNLKTLSVFNFTLSFILSQSLRLRAGLSLDALNLVSNNDFTQRMITDSARAAITTKAQQLGLSSEYINSFLLKRQNSIYGTTLFEVLSSNYIVPGSEEADKAAILDAMINNMSCSTGFYRTISPKAYDNVFMIPIDNISGESNLTLMLPYNFRRNNSFSLNNRGQFETKSLTESTLFKERRLNFDFNSDSSANLFSLSQFDVQVNFDSRVVV